MLNDYYEGREEREGNPDYREQKFRIFASFAFFVVPTPLFSVFLESFFKFFVALACFA